MLGGPVTSEIETAAPKDIGALAARVNSIRPWFHSIDLGNGLVTPGAGKIDKLTQMANVYFALGLHGLSVLDVGAWDGFFSFEAERRGAARVLAADKYCWGGGRSRKTLGI